MIDKVLSLFGAPREPGGVECFILLVLLLLNLHIVDPVPFPVHEQQDTHVPGSRYSHLTRSRADN